jgi:HEAT repeat protein
MRAWKCLVAVICTLGLLGGSASVWAQQSERRSVDGLVHDLKHPDASRRAEAARLLGENRVRSAVPDLIESTEDADANVRHAAARALLQINDTRALHAFVRLTRDSERRIQRVAVEGIVNIYVIEEGGFVTGVRRVVSFLNPLSDDYDTRVVEPYMPVSQDAINALTDLLFVRDRNLRKDAAVALGILRARSALTAIEDALNRERANDVKVELIRTVYKIGDREAGEMVVPFIRDSDRRTRDEAILTAGRLRVTAAVPMLNNLYRLGIEDRRRLLGVVPVSGADDLQRKVLEALAHIGDESSKDIFEDALNDSRDFYRRYAAEGLGRTEDDSYVGLLARQHLRESSSSVRLAMGYALFLMGREEHIVELIDQSQGDQAYYYLLELPPDRVTLLYPYLNSERDAVVVRLLDVVGMSGGPDALPRVQDLMRHGNPDVASAANLAVRRLQGRFPQG